jgi:hypothetical protein
MSGLVDLFISFSTLGGQQQQTFPSLEPHYSSSKVLPLVPKQIQNSKILVVLLSGAIESRVVIQLAFYTPPTIQVSLRFLILVSNLTPPFTLSIK